jgi:hypothetical protein
MHCDSKVQISNYKLKLNLKSVKDNSISRATMPPKKNAS